MWVVRFDEVDPDFVTKNRPCLAFHAAMELDSDRVKHVT